MSSGSWLQESPEENAATLQRNQRERSKRLLPSCTRIDSQSTSGFCPKNQEKNKIKMKRPSPYQKTPQRKG